MRKKRRKSHFFLVPSSSSSIFNEKIIINPIIYVMKPPLVSVIMPTYNVEKYVEEAVNSILDQTFSDFEFIIVDDGSTDRTTEILRSYTDPRIQLLSNEKNEGNYPARNRGCRLARGKYLAVMDGDDVAMPERLKRQVKFMEENPDLLACGTAYRIIDKNQIIVEPTEWEDIRYILMKTFCMLHPTLLIRKEALGQLGFYGTESRYAEDYDLVLRLARIGKVVNIPDVLLNRRWHDEQISRMYKRQQNDFAGKKLLSYQHECGIYYPPKNPDFFLQHLVAYLRATVSYVSQGGLHNGRLGIILFFYLYARYKQETEYHKIADLMLEKILNELKNDMPIDLNFGVCGLGFQLGYLLSEGFVEGDTDEVLEEIDRMVVEKTDFDSEDRSLGTGLSGLLYYVAYRLGSSTPWVNQIFTPAYRQRWIAWIEAWENHPAWAVSKGDLLTQCKKGLSGEEFIMDWKAFWRQMVDGLPQAHSLGQWPHGLFHGGAGWGVDRILNLNICREKTYKGEADRPEL